MESTLKQIENARMAYAIFAGFPAHKVYLDTFRFNRVDDKELLKPCGTSGCVAGVLSAHPYFKKQGMRFMVKADEPVIKFGGAYYNTWEYPSLGRQVFGPYGDQIFSGGPDKLRGKRLGLERIRQFLLDAGAITKERNAELIAYERTLA